MTQDDNVLVQIDDATITANQKSKMVSFTSKMILETNSSKFLGKGQYFIAQNLADCEKDTVARLYVAKYDRNGKQLSEERYSYSNLSSESPMTIKSPAIFKSMCVSQSSKSKWIGDSSYVRHSGNWLRSIGPIL